MNKYSLFLLANLIILIATSCNKDAELIDDNPSNNQLTYGVIDSFKVKSYTIKDNPSNGKNLNNVLLGASNDTRFGFYKAAFYAQFSLSQNDFDLGTNPILDSVVLVLDKSKHYGDLNALFNLDVYEINHNIDNVLTYDNTTVLNIKSSPLASFSNFQFDKNTEVMRLKLNNTFGTNLLNQFGTNTMLSSENFKTFFNGIYVTATATNADGFVTLALKNDISKIELFYSSDTQTDTSYSFIVDNADVNINQYNTNITGSEASTAILDSDIDENISYISSMTAVKTVLEFPDLSSLEQTIINKADLTIYSADYGTLESIKLPEPENLFLFHNLNDTSISFLPDFSLSNPSPFGGKKELVVVNGQNTYKYTFNITRYIQSLVNNSSESTSLYLSDILNNEGNRIKIGGGSNTTLPIKLEILYTQKK